MPDEVGSQIPTLHEGKLQFLTQTKFDEFDLPKDGSVALTVYNLRGKKVETLIEGSLPAGFHRVYFHGANLSSGIYFYRLKAGSTTMLRKMVLVR